MNARIVALVRERAGYRCEYCQIVQEQDPFFSFHIEHVIARKHGGAGDPDNLALSCHQDNLHKGTDLTGIDSVTQRITRLYHPRRQRWRRHFRWDGARIVGITAVGRTTVQVLAMNAPDRIALREALLDAGEFPPRLP